jgi:hypothetical protein
MSSRIAHRPRYRTMRQLAQQTSRHVCRDFLATRWSYRRQTPLYEKRPLGYSLSLLPLGYRFLQGVLIR